MRLRIMTIGLVALGCSQDIQPPPVRNLDRPSAIDFACYGDMRIVDPDSSKDGDVVVSAQPLESCTSRQRGDIPEGQENIEGEPPLVPPRTFAFVLQSAKGTVGVIETETQVVLDSDPLTPGKNSIPIGTLPVGLAADASGCYMMAANAGSCDLGVLDVTSALRLGDAARIARLPITNAAGELMRARPRTMIAGPQEETVGLECPSSSGPVRPRGQLFIAYPTCHLVAVVDAATGAITSGIQFDEDGVPTITDGNVSCPQECGDGSIVPTSTARVLPGGIDAGIDAGIDSGPLPDAGPATTDDTMPRPVALDLGPDGRLYIGAENSPLVTAVTLDDAGLPSAAIQARLEGSVGVTALAASHVVEEGGELGALGGSGGNFQFLYAVATDRTVRVVDLERNLECDAQVDPRYLYDVHDPGFLSCMAVGDPTTPPRRPGARSPGIHMPRDSVPLDVSFALVNPSTPVGEVSPVDMVGTYAFITTSDGFVYIVNVDDDNYPDFEDEDDPTRANLTLAIPHQMRDFVQDRDAVAQNCQPPTAEPPEIQLGPRLTEPPTLLVTEERVALDKLHLLPNFHQVMCTAGDDRAAVSELDFTAPVEVRESVYPDWRPIFNERFTVTWEGPLSRDDVTSDVDGPPVRNGLVEQLETRVRLRDPNQPFCQIGAEPFDIITLIGCDPAFGDAQCGIGEVCYVHPDTSTVVQSGVCMPGGKTDQLSGLCRDFLISRRQYAARSVYAGEVTLGNRRRLLRTSPLEGCTSDDQCQQMAGYETTLDDPAHPIDLSDSPASSYSWTCVDDPTRVPGPDRCLMTCEDSSDCEAGLACYQGFCIEGVIPPAECVSTVQRYTVRGSDTFVVVGSRTGYLHNRIQDEASGECVQDPEANPLVVGRIPLTAPPCTGDGFDAVSPNPCSTTVEQAEVVVGYDLEGQRCVAKPEALRERETNAIRLTNPVFRMNVVDVATSGDAECVGDRAGTLPAFSPVYPGFQMVFDIVGGFFPMFVVGVESSFPIRIQPGPDGRLWVLDEGDSSISTFGRVFTLIPDLAREGFGVIQIL